jgi:hypothetical protein
MDLIKLHKVKEFALQKMEEWGLIEEGWSFVWDTRAVRRYGQCRYRQREIGVTKVLANLNTIEETKDVVLHEIAHALTGPGHGHDWLWKQKCVLVGARPERCYTSELHGGNVKTTKGKYKLINRDTGEVYRYYYRRPKNKDWSTRWLIGKKRETFGKLQVVRC